MLQRLPNGLSITYQPRELGRNQGTLLDRVKRRASQRRQRYISGRPENWGPRGYYVV
jgi:hypothetical protein